MAPHQIAEYEIRGFELEHHRHAPRRIRGAPAILTNACSVLGLGTANRLARVVDRTRVITAQIASLEPGTPGYQGYISQLERQKERAKLLLGALRVFYASLGSFAAAALISV